MIVIQDLNKGLLHLHLMRGHIRLNTERVVSAPLSMSSDERAYKAEHRTAVSAPLSMSSDDTAFG
jgi:hypothetical protein